MRKTGPEGHYIVDR